MCIYIYIYVSVTAPAAIKFVRDSFTAFATLSFTFISGELSA